MLLQQLFVNFTSIIIIGIMLCIIFSINPPTAAIWIATSLFYTTANGN